MKISDKAQNNSIDEYYKGESNLSSEYDDKLRASLEKMNILKEDPYDFHIDISDIIDEGENVKAKGQDKIELLWFCATALLIISLIFVSVISKVISFNY